MKKIVKTDGAPKAIGAYSQAILLENFLFTSGQLPINPKTGEMAKDCIITQTQQVMENLKNILKEEGMTFSNVIKANIFITDMDNFSNVNEVYAKYFSDVFPSRSCIEVNKLPKGALVEIEMIAHK